MFLDLSCFGLVSETFSFLMASGNGMGKRGREERRKLSGWWMFD